MSLDGLKREFDTPANRFRFAPFWFLNHELSEGETRWQVREMNEHGVGGFILHARHGLLTPYLSEEWMEQIGVAIDEGKKLGMKAYLYDENNWPSGPADAKVFEGHPEYRMSSVIISDEFDIQRGKVNRTLQVGDELIAVIAVPLEQGKPAGFPESALNLADFIDGCELQWRASQDYRIYVFSRMWHVGTFFGSYVDVLNPDAIARFIELTHTKYTERFAEEFGATIDGMFTDEHAMRTWGEENASWTPRRPGEFEWRAGYPLQPVLPALFRDMGPQPAKIRCDYWATVTDLFANNYMKQIYDYCDSVGLNSIGHLLAEGELMQGTCCYGDYFQAAQYLHWGGCDYLCEGTWPTTLQPWDTDAYPANNLAACKFASSAAHLLGKPVVMCEAFGLASQWAIDLRNLKWMSDFVIALGVNLLEPHAFYYSIQGFRKWECPPGEFYQSPFWSYYRLLSDYTGRLCGLFRNGQHCADVAFLYPNKSMWAEMAPGGNEVTTPLVDSFNQLTKVLLKLNYDFDFVSEEMLQAADFTDGQIGIKRLDGEIAERFKILVMPAVTTISRKTAEALEQYVAEGGRIIALGSLPTKSVEYGEDEAIGDAFREMFGEDYKRSLKVTKARRPVTSKKNLKGWTGGLLVGSPPGTPDEAMLAPLGEALKAGIEADVTIVDTDGQPVPDIVHLHYIRNDAHFLLLQNTSREQTHQCTVSVGFTGDVSFWDAESGEIKPVYVAHGKPDGLSVPLSLPPTVSTILCIEPDFPCPRTPIIDADLPLVEITDKEAVGLVSEPGRYSVTVGSHSQPRVVSARVRSLPSVIDLDDVWEFETQKPNALPLVRWDYEMDNYVSGRDSATERRIYTTSFEAEIIPAETRLLRDGLAVEKVWQRSEVIDYRVLVNGEQLTDLAPGQYLDHYIYEASLEGILRKGRNEVQIITAGHLYEPGALRDPAIIVGRFAVAGQRRPRLVAEPQEIGSGGWDKQGYRYYSGIGTYRQQFRVSAAQKNCRLYLQMQQPGDLAEGIVNGKSCGARAWEPFEWDITAVVKSGSNDLEIRVANSLQNLLVQEPKPSGLLGKVRIVPHKTVSFTLRART